MAVQQSLEVCRRGSPHKCVSFLAPHVHITGVGSPLGARHPLDVGRSPGGPVGHFGRQEIHSWQPALHRGRVRIWIS